MKTIWMIVIAILLTIIIKIIGATNSEAFITYLIGLVIGEKAYEENK